MWTMSAGSTENREMLELTFVPVGKLFIVTLLNMASAGLNISKNASLLTCRSASVSTNLNAACTRSTFDCSFSSLVFLAPLSEVRKSTFFPASNAELDLSFKPFSSSLPKSGAGNPPGSPLTPEKPVGSSRSNALHRNPWASGTILRLCSSY